MYTLAGYTSSILTLSNSLTVKIVDVGIAINTGLLVNNNITPSSDKTTWKYFMNLAGIRHETNTKVEIHIIETGNTEELTKELLATYKYTRLELMKNSIFYNDLISRYPNDISFINGCIYPVDIETAINAEDGTILAYNETLVEVSEYTLISELEIYIKNFLRRWHVRAYTITDDLYLPAMLGVLYSSIPNIIQNIRLDNIQTEQVHSFHMEHYFRSHLDIWDDISVLNNSSKYWLYKNLRYLIKHTGKDSNFNTILTNIFNVNNVGVGEYILKTPTPAYLENSNLLTPNTTVTQPISISKKLNDSYILDNNSINSIDSLVGLELSTLEQVVSTTNTNKNSYISRTVQDKLTYLKYDNAKTKVLDLNLMKLFQLHGIDLYKMVIDHWIICVKENSYNTVVDYTNPTTSGKPDLTQVAELVEYTDPNTNQTYTVTPRTGLLMVIKLMLSLANATDTKLTTLITSNVLTTDLDEILTVTDKIYNDGYIEEIVNIVADNIPQRPSVISDPIDMYDYLSKMITFYKYLWVLDANSENTLLSSNIKQVLNRLVTYEHYDLTIDNTSYTVDELLALEGVTYKVDNSFNILLSITGLIKTFTKIEVNEYTGLKETLYKYISILTKLTSYTTQIINNADDTAPIYLRYNAVGNNKTKNGLITVLESDLTPLEQNEILIEAMGSDYRNQLYCNYTLKEPLVVSCDKPIIGFGINSRNLTNEIAMLPITPCVYVEIHDLVRCNAIDYQYKDEFILGISGRFEPLESIALTSKTVESNIRDIININDGYTSPLVKDSDVILQGYMAADITQTDEFAINFVIPVDTIELTDK